MNAKIVIMTSLKIVVVLLWGSCICIDGASASASVGDECSNELQSVTACLGYATGKAGTPTKECCSAVTSIKDKNPVCLCYVIEQVHNGTNPQLKSIGIQESLLLLLPSACKLANATSSECPKLLHLAPNSPEAAIFNNITAPTTPSSVTRTPSSSSSSTGSGSDGYKTVPKLTGSMAVAIGVLLFAMFT